MSQWPFSNMIVIVEADIGTCYNRLLQRGLTKYLRGKSYSEINYYLNQGITAIREINRQARERNIPTVKIFNNYDSVDNLTKAPEWAKFIEHIEINQEK